MKGLLIRIITNKNQVFQIYKYIEQWTGEEEAFQFLSLLFSSLNIFHFNKFLLQNIYTCFSKYLFMFENIYIFIYITYTTIDLHLYTYIYMNINLNNNNKYSDEIFVTLSINLNTHIFLNESNIDKNLSKCWWFIIARQNQIGRDYSYFV